MRTPEAVSQSRARLFASLLLLLLVGLYWAQRAAAQASAFVIDRVLVSSTRYTRDLSDFTYKIRLTNQGGALVGARAVVRSLSPNTQILDNEVTLGTVAAGVTILSSDTFAFRQNRLVAFNPDDLVWTIQGQPANTRPLANAGPDQTVRAGDTVVLDGTASTDADGNPLAYRWTLVSRPAGSNAALNSVTAGRPTFRVDRGGTFVFALVVNDGLVDSASDEVRISTVNSTPTANAGADRTVARGATVTLDGSASSDPDFDALAFTWSLVNAPAGSTATLLGANSANPQITLDRAGSYTFRLTVSDGALTSAADFVSLSTENSLPVAAAGPDQIATLGARITLDGRASSDADNDPLSLAWTLLSRPAGSAAALDVSDSFQPTFVPDRAGLYVAQLIVNDGFANSVPDTVSVTINVPANNRPVAVNDAGSTLAGVPVTIDVLANDTDPDAGTTLSIASFSQPPSGGVVVQVAGGLQFTPAAGFAGVATFQYVVTDGDLTATAFVTVTVTAANLAPVVNAGPDRSATLPQAGAATVTLSGVVSDDGKPLPPSLVMGWSVVSGPGVVSFSAPNAAITDASFASAGTYVLRLTASDGLLASQDDVTVVVNPPANTPPVLSAISNRTISVGTPLRLHLVANDPDVGDVLAFALGASPAGATLVAPATLDWTPANNQLGAQVFTVTVRDAAGASDTKSFTVTVAAGNRAPVFGPLPDDTTATQARYSKTISASDPDGDAVTLSLLDGPAGLALTGNVITWQPGSTQTGVFAVKLRASDSHAASSAALYRITVEAGNPPVAREDEYIVKQGETLSVAAAGVLANDLSLAGGALTANKLSDPALGSLAAFNADGSFTYVAPAQNPRPAFTVTKRAMTDQVSPFQYPNDLGAGGPLLGDINHDGKPDLVFNGQGGPLVAISGGDGHVLWQTGGRGNDGCSVNETNNSAQRLMGDIDDDGQVEVVAVAGCIDAAFFTPADRLMAFRPDGTRKWLSEPLTKPFFEVMCHPINGCPTPEVPQLIEANPLFYSALSLVRLGPNEAPVILARQVVAATDGQVFTRLADGTLGFKSYGCRLLTGLEEDMGKACSTTMIISPTDGHVIQVLKSPYFEQYALGIPFSPAYHNPPLAVDLDGDGSVEIVSGADVWKRVNGVWTLSWQLAGEPEQVAVADLDGDGRPELVYGIDRDRNLAPGTPYLGFVGILIVDADGHELRRISLPNTFPGLITIADLDGDGTPELLLPEGGNVHAIGVDGSFRWTYAVPDNAVFSVPAFQRTQFRANIAVYDLDGDGNKEVMLSTPSGTVFLDARTGAEKLLLNSGRRLANFYPNALFVTDWDNDGHADLIDFAQGTASAASPGAIVITATNNDWLPASHSFNQTALQTSSIDDSGHVLFDPSVQRSYRNPKQLGAVRDPRETAGVSFDYVASDGAGQSNPAKVFIKIAPPNNPPAFTSRPPTAIQAQGPSPFIYQATAVDPDQGDTITYSLAAAGRNGISGPPYITVDPQTGAVSFLRSPSFGTFTVRVTLTATDSFGATATQTFVLRHELLAPVAVPSVIGSSAIIANETLAASDLQSAVLQEQFNAAAAGTVFAQSPLAGSTQPRGTTVLLTVSKGPAPTIVPNVLGRSQATATTALTAAGFSAIVTRQFSNGVASGLVLSQSVAAGSEQSGGSIGIVVSAGTGLELRLSRSITPSNVAIPFTLVATDIDGNSIGSPAANVTLAAVTAASGGLPTVAGGAILPAANTRGVYRITAVDGARQASADFVVTQPNTLAKPTQLELFAQFDGVLATMSQLLAEANSARLANDLPTMNAKMTAWVATWRSFDIGRLALAVPVVPENGFPAEVGDMAGFGVTQSADDALNKRILEDANDDLEGIETALRDPQTPYVQIRNLFAAFNGRAERQSSVSPGEYGVIDAKGLYAEVLAHRIPRVMDALVADVARAYGLPAQQPRFPGLVSNGAPANGLGAQDFATGRPMQAALGAARATGYDARMGSVQVSSTLAEQLTVIVVKELTDAIGGGYTLRKFYEDAGKNAAAGALIVAAAHHLKAATNGADLAVTTSSSLAINYFNTAYSTMEGLGLNGAHRPLNQVMVIGPALFNAFKSFIDNILALGGLPSDATAVARARDLDEVHDGLIDFHDKAKEQFDAIQLAGNDLVTAISNVYQTPLKPYEHTDCLFESGPRCQSIQYPFGFRSVYDKLGLNLPVPILFLVVNMETGETLVGSPAFLPGH